MLNPSFKGILKEGDSRYTLVMLASKRSRELIGGAEPLIEIDTTNSTKPLSIAIDEILAKKITYKNPPIE